MRNEGFYTWAAEFDKATEARRQARKRAAKAGATQRIPDLRRSKLARIEKKERKHEHET